MIKLLDYFCPTCVEQPLNIDDSDGKQVYACASCGSNYPVIDGIPRFVTTDEYVGNFSFESAILSRLFQQINDQFLVSLY